LCEKLKLKDKELGQAAQIVCNLEKKMVPKYLLARYF